MEEVYRSFYTKSQPILSYMIRLLSVDEGDRILEPCAGDGVFVDELINKQRAISVDIYEINPKAFNFLKGKYSSFDFITITLGDTLTSKELIYFSDMGGVYDRIIANPPYGGWLDYEKRKYLKRLYPQLYVKETYGLFLYRSIRLLKDKGRLVFIIPDTFLNLHMHKNLRKVILTNTKILEICLFPSSFFPGVNFGYSNLAIITLQKCLGSEEWRKNAVRVITGFKHVDELADLNKKEISHHQIYIFRQESIFNNIDHALFVSANPKITYMINTAEKRIGDIADCVTGFYSGNDKKYLYTVSDSIKNATKYRPLDKSKIYNEYSKRNDILDGIEEPNHYIPIHKGGGVKYYKPDVWFMDWSIRAVKDYKTNKKARFQNSKYYFRYGIGVPMVSSSQMTGSLIEHRLFDQSIVGVFLRDEGLTYYLLSFFNSPTCNKLIRTINPSANNPANYIKKIPFIHPPADELKKINKKVEKIILSLKAGRAYPSQLESDLYKSIERIYGF